MSEQIGPNVKKLVAHKMSLLLIPPGSGKDAIGIAISGMIKPGNLVAIGKQAIEWVKQAIAVVRTAPDCPYKDDEEIAGAILAEVEKRKAK